VDGEAGLLLPLSPQSHAAAQSAIASDVRNHREGE